MIVAVEAPDGRTWRVVDCSDGRELGVYFSRATAVRHAENDAFWRGVAWCVWPQYGAPHTPAVIDLDSRRRA